MSNIFETVLTDLNGVEMDLLGPAYPYYKNVVNPNEMGISSNGTMQALANDIEALIGYVGLLVDGNCDLSGVPCASTTGGPLGNKFFLKTGAQCQAVDNNNELVDRYIYVDNVPSGNIPFISNALGVDFSNFQGLIPGAMSDLNVLNPYSILQSFLAPPNQQCSPLTMETIDNNNVVSSETNYVTLTDIQNMDPCSFPNGYNTASGQTCTMIGFTNMNNEKKEREKKQRENKNISLPKDLTVQIYYASLALIGIFILYKIMEKSK